MPSHVPWNGGWDALWIRRYGGPLKLPGKGGDSEGIPLLEVERLAPGARASVHFEASAAYKALNCKVHTADS